MTGRRMAAIAALLLLPCLPARSIAARGQSLNVSAGLATAYDNNFMQFSDKQITIFKSGTHPLRYAVESTDDGLFTPDLSLTWQLDEGGGRRHALRLRWEGDFHARNSTADHHATGVRWTETFGRGRRLSAGWYQMNNYYLRQLPDGDLPVALLDSRYQRAQFDLNIYSAGWRQRLGQSMHADLGWQFENRKYVPAFRERTSGTHQGDVHLDWDRLPHRADVDVRFGWRKSLAKGTDGDEVGGVRDSDDVDVSYHGPEAGISGRMEFRRDRLWRFGGDLGWELGKRAFDSPLATDRYHYGRHDTMNAVEAGLRLGFRRHWTARAYYRLENNTAKLGASAPLTSESGSYHENRFGLELGWSGLVWQPAAAADEAGGD